MRDGITAATRASVIPAHSISKMLERCKALNVHSGERLVKSEQ